MPLPQFLNINYLSPSNRSVWHLKKETGPSQAHNYLSSSIISVSTEEFNFSPKADLLSFSRAAIGFTFNVIPRDITGIPQVSKKARTKGTQTSKHWRQCEGQDIVAFHTVARIFFFKNLN
jgi:hypothetical protein